MLLTHTTPRIDQNRAIDADQLQAIALVSELHAFAAKCEGEDRTLVERAACLLDDCRAGLTLFTPHESAGYELIETAQLPVAA